jgi:alkaline phosphatase
MATGHKVNNGVISQATPGDGHAYETTLEYFARRGKRTGLATTTWMTHATPATFGAHTSSRHNYTVIADQLLNNSQPDVLFGGGGYGVTATGAVSSGYTVVTTRDELLALNAATVTKASGQFGSGNLPYAWRAPPSIPSLSNMTEVAIDILSRGTNGFFLMVEGGRIDHASHANDIANCVGETIAFDAAISAALAWVSNRTDTLLIVTADHETGGLTVLTNNGPGVVPSVSWSSGGHTKANVGVFAIGPGSTSVTGVLDNTDIYRIMMRD